MLLLLLLKAEMPLVCWNVVSFLIPTLMKLLMTDPPLSLLAFFRAVVLNWTTYLKRRLLVIKDLDNLNIDNQYILWNLVIRRWWSFFFNYGLLPIYGSSVFFFFCKISPEDFNVVINFKRWLNVMWCQNSFSDFVICTSKYVVQHYRKNSRNLY